MIVLPIFTQIISPFLTNELEENKNVIPTPNAFRKQIQKFSELLSKRALDNSFSHLKDNSDLLLCSDVVDTLHPTWLEFFTDDFIIEFGFVNTAIAAIHNRGCITGSRGLTIWCTNNQSNLLGIISKVWIWEFDTSKAYVTMCYLYEKLA